MNHLRRWRLAAAALAVAGQGLPALADDAASKLWPPGEERCYGVRFDANWLAKHKGQLLTDFYLYRLLRPNPAKETIEPDAADAAKADRQPDASHDAAVAARLKGKDGWFSQSLYCSSEGNGAGLRCGVECDGGSVLVTPEAHGLALRFEPGNGLSLNQSCGDPDEEGHDHWLSAKEAGTAFSLAARPAEDCVAPDGDTRPTFASDPVPLRSRIAADGWTCLSRSYDKAHLRRHPHQKVVAMAVALKGPATVSTDAEGWRTTGIAVTLSLKLRDGKTESHDVACTADEYQFRCGDEFRLRRRDSRSALLLSGSEGGSEAATPPRLLGLALGSDDQSFRLDAAATGSCKVN